MGWCDVAFGNGFGFLPNACFQLAGGLLGGCHIGLLLGSQQAFVVFVGEFGINRQPQRAAVIALAGQADGKVHGVAVVGVYGHLAGVLIGREHLLQQGAQLRFAKHAAHLHIGEQVFEVAHALCQRLHFA